MPISGVAVEEQRREHKEILQPLAWTYQGDNVSIHVVSERDRVSMMGFHNGL